MPANKESSMRYRAIVVFALSLLAWQASFSETPPKPTGIFTDMSYHSEGGDMLGTELFVVKSNHGYYVIYQSSEGEPSVPVVIPAKVDGTKINFDVPSSVDSNGSFSGVISNTGLIGTFSDSQQIVHLRRASSYWQ
jgi:hypothetical protein